MTERDQQRGKLYKAERVALEAIAKPLPTVKDVERYLARQIKRKTLVKRYGAAIMTVPIIGDGRGTRRALAHGTTKITLPLWARSEWVALHEMAHIVHGRLRFCYGGSRRAELNGGASHGWQFAAVYMDLVKFCMGKEAGEALKTAFKTHRVRFTKPRPKRELTDDQRKVLADRMAIARAAKIAT